jgi:hypothetical protein
MADNIELNAGTGGAIVAADDISSVWYQIQKLAFGPLNTATLVTATEGLPVAQEGTWDIGTVTTVTAVTDITNTVTVDGSGVTQPVSHAALTELAAAIDTEVQVDIVGALPAGTNNIGDVDVLSSALPTGAATSANQTTIIGHVDGIEALLTTIDADTSTLAAAVSTEFQVDVVGALPAGDNNIGNVDIVTFPTTVHSADYDSGAGTDTTLALGIAVPASGGAAVITVDASNGLDVDVTRVTGTVTVDGSGVTQPVSHAALTELAAAINASSQMDVNIAAAGTTVPISHSALTDLGAAIDTEVQVDVVGSLPAGTNNIGDVDVLSLPAIPAGANVIGAVTQSGTWNVGTVTTVSAVTAISNALPAGTNAIGKLVPSDKDITGHSAYMKKYYTNAGAVTDGIVWSPAAGTRWHVTTLIVNVSAAATVTFEDDKSGGDEAVMKFEFAANSGTVINFDPLYPWASGEDAADLIVTTSAGNVYITAVGYEV